MINLHEIHKPKNIQDAIKLLRQPNTVALAGGTQLIASKREDVQAVVDLSGLGLSYIHDKAGAVAIGATTTLADVSGSPILRAAAKGVLAQAAHRTAASVLRNQATIAGTLISEPNGILATTLLALDALIVCEAEKTMQVAITDFLAMLDHFTMGAIVAEIIIPAASLGKRAAIETVARTPRDKPIVCVCAAARIDNEVAREVRIALGGVAWSAVRAGKAERDLENKGLGDAVIEEAAFGAVEGLSPRGDYRGSVEYRREMAVVLTRRAVRELIG
jgi:probable selenate reductase FAD-binding subunit